jgi:hypothetical protein
MVTSVILLHIDKCEEEMKDMSPVEEDDFD